MGKQIRDLHRTTPILTESRLLAEMLRGEVLVESSLTMTRQYSSRTKTHIQSASVVQFVPLCSALVSPPEKS